jgi:hypothetical protein
MRFRIVGPLVMWDGHGWAGGPHAKQRILLAALPLKAVPEVALRSSFRRVLLRRKLVSPAPLRPSAHPCG